MESWDGVTEMNLPSHCQNKINIKLSKIQKASVFWHLLDNRQHKPGSSRRRGAHEVSPTVACLSGPPPPQSRDRAEQSRTVPEDRHQSLEKLR